MIGFDKITVNEQSSIKIEGSSTLYFDPFHIEGLFLDADMVFITHGHYDHFSPEDINKVASGNAMFIVPAKLLKEVKETGVSDDRIVAFKPGDEMSIKDRKGNDIKILAVPAYNSKKPFHPKSHKWCGYVVTMDDTVFYIAGDTDAVKDNEDIRCDVAFIPIGGTYTMNYKEAAAFTNSLEPKAVVPIHYGTIVGEPAYGDRFEELVADGITVVRKLF